MTPDFAARLQTTYRDSERVGRMLKNDGIIDARQIGKIITNIRKTAAVVVKREVGKFASAHDLRRSLGTRWAIEVKPANLKLLIRHSEIKTTTDVCVDRDAADVAHELWANHGSTRPKSTRRRPNRSAESIDVSACDAKCSEQVAEAGIEPARPLWTRDFKSVLHMFTGSERVANGA